MDNQSTVVTGSRDGNILIFDIRAPGKKLTPSNDDAVPRRSGRHHQRYSNGIPGFAPQEGREIGPVMEVKNAHGDRSKRVSTLAALCILADSDVRRPQKDSPKTVTSLVCLASMPGMFASGGSADG